MADIDELDTEPAHDTLDYGELEVVDPEGPPRELPPVAYEVLEDGEHEYPGDDAPVQ